LILRSYGWLCHQYHRHRWVRHHENRSKKETRWAAPEGASEPLAEVRVEFQCRAVGGSAERRPQDCARRFHLAAERHHCEEKERLGCAHHHAWDLFYVEVKLLVLELAWPDHGRDHDLQPDVLHPSRGHHSYSFRLLLRRNRLHDHGFLVSPAGRGSKSRRLVYQKSQYLDRHDGKPRPWRVPESEQPSSALLRVLLEQTRRRHTGRILTATAASQRRR